MRYTTTPTRLAAERWYAIAAASVAQRLAEMRPTATRPIRVSTTVFNGYHHVVTSVEFGAYGPLIKPTITAWRLMPIELFDGAVYRQAHDEAAVRRGERQRGDMTGLMARIYGSDETMVCDRRVTLELALPERILGMETARKWNDAASLKGWRAASTRKGSSCAWASLDGHPVVCYEGLDGRPRRALIWRMPDGRIDEIAIDADQALDGPEQAQNIDSGAQLSLL